MTILDPLIQMLEKLNTRLKGSNGRSEDSEFSEIKELNASLPDETLTLFLPPHYDRSLQPVKADRYRKWWEQDSKTRNHARFCLPLTMGAGVGWYILSPATFKVTWDGDEEHDAEVEVLEPSSHAVIDNHSAHGSFTVQACFVPRTKNPGEFVYVKGVANSYRLKYHVLEALVEAWWNPANFGLVCMINQAGTFTIQKGEPLAQMFVVNAEQAFYSLNIKEGYPPRWQEWDEKRSSPLYNGKGLDYLRGVWPDETPVCPHFKNWSPSAKSGVTRASSPEEAMVAATAAGANGPDSSEAPLDQATSSPARSTPKSPPKLFPSQQKKHAEAINVENVCRELAELNTDKDEGLDINEAEHLHRVAYLAVKEGKYEEAKQILERCLHIRHRLLGGKDDRVAQTYNDLGYAYRMLGDLDKSEQCYAHTLEIRRNAIGDSARLALTCAEYGGLLDYLGKRDQALPLLEEAYALRKKHSGENHPDTLFSLNALACVYAHIGRHEEAEEIFHDVIERRTKLLGENNLDVANSHIDLAFLYRDLDEIEACVQEYLKGIEIQQNVLGEDALETAFTFEHIAFAYRERGDLDSALSYFETVLRIKEKHLDRHDPLMSKTFRDMAFVCKDAGREEEALLYFAEADGT